MNVDDLQEAIGVIASRTDAYALTYRHRGDIEAEAGNQPDLQDEQLHFRLLAAHLEAIHRGSGVPRDQLAQLALDGSRKLAGSGDEAFGVRGDSGGK